jgi:hypothetical protein
MAFVPFPIRQKAIRKTASLNGIIKKIVLNSNRLRNT